MERLTAGGGYEKLSLAYESFIALLAERDYSPGQLASKLDISKQACSKTIRELEQLGLIERRRNPADSRSSLLSLTGKGRDLLHDGIAATNEIEEQFARAMGLESPLQLVCSLEKLCRGFQVEIPDYPLLNPGQGEMPASRLPRLNLLLRGLSTHFRHTLFEALRGKGFHGLKPSFGQVLGLLSREERHIQYIAPIIGISKQAVAATAVELEQQGYIHRRPDPEDRRQILLSLSPLGRQLVAESEASVRALEADIRGLLSEAEFRFLERALASLYLQVAESYDAARFLPSKIKQLSESLLEELGAAGSRALAQQLITMTRGVL